jgi:uncharacterized protein with NRDE domain
MCILAFAKNVHPEYPFIMIGNRDEFYRRPTLPAHWWDDNLLAGKDLEAGGTWLGMSRDGKLATLTNYRDISGIKTDARTRGSLPLDFLTGDADQLKYHETISQKAEAFNGFNLLTWQNGEMYHFSNYENKINQIPDGVHSLSNALLNSSWPKTQLLAHRFEQSLSQGIDINDWFELLTNEQKADDDQLPSTGLTIAREKAVSSICIRTPDYGTCSSTIVLINTKNEVTFVERNYSVGNRKAQTNTFKFKIEP